MKLTWTKIDPDNLPEDQTGFALVYYGDREFWAANGETPALHPDRDLIERTDLAFWDDGALCEQGTAHDVFEEWNGKGTPTHFAPIELSAPDAPPQSAPAESSVNVRVVLKGQPEALSIPVDTVDEGFEKTILVGKHLKQHGFKGWAYIGGVLINMSEVQAAYVASPSKLENEDDHNSVGRRLIDSVRELREAFKQ